MRSVGNYLRMGAFQLLYGLVKYVAIPFSGYLRLGVLRLFTTTIRTHEIADGVQIYFPWNIRIGQNTSLNEGVILDGFGGLTIGDNVRIAPRVMINTADHRFADPDIPIRLQGYECAPVVIEDDVWIGTMAAIGKGVTIGRGAVVGAGAVVVRDVPPFTVVGGIPARVIGKRGP